MSTQTSDNNKRIAKNTGLLYLRMFILMFVSLYTSRIVFQQLGVEDFGINNVVGGFVSILAFFTSSLSNVTQRFLNIGLGKGDIEKTTFYFRQSFTIMLFISFLVLIVGETVGLWFVVNKLVIPHDRLIAAIFVYQFAVFSAICSIIQVSFIGAIVAREKMDAYAYLGLFEAFARLGIAFALMFSSMDHLILFGILTGLISFCTTAFYICYAIKHFPECKCRLYYEKSLLREMSQFVGVNLFGCLAWSAGVQGITIILNLFFGPIVNTARGIATQVCGIVMRFTDSIMTAVKPQIIKSYATGDISYMEMLVEKSSKFSFFLVSFIAVPVIIECQRLLSIWLGQVPDYAVPFTRLVICEQIFNVFISPLWIVANATGNIVRNQLYGRLFSLASLPLSYLILRIAPNPIYPMLVLVFANIAYWLYCVWDIHKQVNLRYKKYLIDVILPSLSLIGLMVVFGLCCYEYIQIANSVLHIVVMTFLIDTMGAIVVLFLLQKQEKKYLYSFIYSKIRRKKG